MLDALFVKPPISEPLRTGHNCKAYTFDVVKVEVGFFSINEAGLRIND